LICRWFSLANIVKNPRPDGRGQILTAQLKIGEKSPDREYCEGVERVDLTITATDMNQESGNGIVSQTVTIIILDENDEPRT